MQTNTVLTYNTPGLIVDEKKKIWIGNTRELILRNRRQRIGEGHKVSRLKYYGLNWPWWLSAHWVPYQKIMDNT